MPACNSPRKLRVWCLVGIPVPVDFNMERFTCFENVISTQIWWLIMSALVRLLGNNLTGKAMSNIVNISTVLAQCVYKVACP